MTDILLAIGLTVSAGFTVALISGGWRGSARSRATVAVSLMAWFGVIVALGVAGALAPDRLGTVGIGVLVFAPVVILAYLAGRVPLLRQVLIDTPVPILVLAHVGRILGIGFLVLHAQGRLAAPFAPIAGWGDVFIACTAIPVALLLALRGGAATRNVALAWNTLGFIDLIVAVGLGVTTAGTAVMTGLPMLLIPLFLVPVYLLTHLAIFYRLAGRSVASQRTGVHVA